MKLSKLQNKVGEFLVDELGMDFTDDGLIRKINTTIDKYKRGDFGSIDLVAGLMMPVLAFAYVENINVKAATDNLTDEMIASHITDTENQAKRPIDEIKVEIEAAVKAIAEKHGVKIRSINQECINTTPDQSPF